MNDRRTALATSKPMEISVIAGVDWKPEQEREMLLGPWRRRIFAGRLMAIVAAAKSNTKLLPAAAFQTVWAKCFETRDIVLRSR